MWTKGGQRQTGLGANSEPPPHTALLTNASLDFDRRACSPGLRAPSLPSKFHCLTLRGTMRSINWLPCGKSHRTRRQKCLESEHLSIWDDIPSEEATYTGHVGHIWQQYAHHHKQTKQHNGITQVYNSLIFSIHMVHAISSQDHLIHALLLLSWKKSSLNIKHMKEANSPSHRKFCLYKASRQAQGSTHWWKAESTLGLNIHFLPSLQRALPRNLVIMTKESWNNARLCNQ